jgi:hypothetical protein
MAAEFSPFGNFATTNEPAHRSVLTPGPPGDPSTISIDEPEEADQKEPPRPPVPEFQPFAFGETTTAEATSVGSFEFKFGDFPQGDPAADDSAFTFDAAQGTPEQSEEDRLFTRFVELLANPCFQHTGTPLVELFRQEDPTESIDAAYEILLGDG